MLDDTSADGLVRNPDPRVSRTVGTGTRLDREEGGVRGLLKACSLLCATCHLRHRVQQSSYPILD